MTRVYKTLAKILGAILLLVGAAAIYGGSWAHNFVSDQLKQERITMPSGAQLTTDDMKNTLTKYAGKQMSTGPEARAFADHYIKAHMNASSGGKTYEEVSGEYIKMGNENPKLKDGTASASELAAYAKLGGLRQSLFMGDALRGMLLTAYAWWTVGTIALWVGALAALAGLGLLIWGLLKGKKHDTVGVADHRDQVVADRTVVTDDGRRTEVRTDGTDVR